MRRKALSCEGACKAVFVLVRFFSVIIFVSACVSAITSPASADERVFIYDSRGRLSKVVDSNGVSLEYIYDDTGNLREIKRSSVSGLTISGFYPQQGSVGTVIRLQGHGFNIIPGANEVHFNGAAATVLSASTSDLVTKVPAGATSGQITVTVNGQTATSGQPFTVVASPVVSAISPKVTTSVSSSATVTSVQVTGVNLQGSAFTFLPAFNPPPLSVSSASVDPGGAAATLNVSIAAGTAGAFTVVATNGAGNSSAFPSSVNTLSVLEGEKDPDGDGLTNAQEATLGTDSFRADTDGDGFYDGFEVSAGSNPLDPNSTPPIHYTYTEVSILNNSDPSVASGVLMGAPISILSLTDPSVASGVLVGAPISILNLTDPSVVTGIYLGAPVSIFNIAVPGGYATGPDVSVDNLPNP